MGTESLPIRWGVTHFKQFLPRDLAIGQIGGDQVSLSLPETRGQWRCQTKETIVRALDKRGMNKLMGDSLGKRESKGRKVELPHPNIGVLGFLPWMAARYGDRRTLPYAARFFDQNLGESVPCHSFWKRVTSSEEVWPCATFPLQPTHLLSKQMFPQKVQQHVWLRDKHSCNLVHLFSQYFNGGCTQHWSVTVLPNGTEMVDGIWWQMVAPTTHNLEKKPFSSLTLNPLTETWAQGHKQNSSLHFKKILSFNSSCVFSQETLLVSHAFPLSTCPHSTAGLWAFPKLPKDRTQDNLTIYGTSSPSLFSLDLGFQGWQYCLAPLSIPNLQNGKLSWGRMSTDFPLSICFHAHT